MPKNKVNLDHIEPQLRQLAVKISDLTPDERQANTHDERSISEIQASLKKHGQKKSIVVRRDGLMVKAGNGTLEAAKRLGWTHIAAVISDDPDELLREYAIRDNRTSEFSSWNTDVLVGEFEALNIEPIDFGWNYTELYNLAPHTFEQGSFDGNEVDDPMNEWRGMPEFEQKDKPAFRSIIVHMKDEESVKSFEKAIGVELKNRKYIWFPEQDIEWAYDKQYVSAEGE